ncbi:MAG: hypothetical protein IID45_09545 [Planctomycetes bacterium]|nr:hypothetical protein [Planctomycetota bacterium]
MMIVAFVMPWWSITSISPRKPDRDDDDYEKKKKSIDKKVKRTGSVMKESEDWYVDMKVDDKLEKKFEKIIADRDDDDNSKYEVTVRLWGWHSGVAITALIFGIFILPVGITPLFVSAIRDWAWIGCFVAAILGLAGLILGMVFYFGSPGENAVYLKQGVGIQPGPWLVMFGSLAVLVAAVWNGVTGLTSFIQGVKGGGGRGGGAGRGRDEFVEDDLEMEEI